MIHRRVLGRTFGTGWLIILAATMASIGWPVWCRAAGDHLASLVDESKPQEADDVRKNGQATKEQEPNADIACRWFPDLHSRPGCDVWTPVGWKSHTSLFNVLQDGSITPVGSKFGRLFIVPSRDASFTDLMPVDQGWKNCHAPVLWTEWVQNGRRLRCELFAHLAGGQDAAKGNEPLFGWIRLSARDAQIESQRGPCGLALRWIVGEIWGSGQAATRAEPTPKAGWRIVDPSGNVLLGIPDGRNVRVSFTPGIVTFFVALEAQKRVHVDVIFPAVGVDEATYDREAKLGPERAFQETEEYWSKIPATAAEVDTPEPVVNQFIKQSLKFREIITTRDTKSGDPCMITGSRTYRACWAENVTHEAVWLLEGMGYHSVNEKYLRTFIHAQGTVIPPGPAYSRHPGYLGAPRFATGADWVSDHGALLYNICSHALLTGDKEFLRNHVDAIIRACEFIKDARALRHPGIRGLLPPAQATDVNKGVQAIWSDGWNHKGLLSAVRLLRKIHHPRAEEFANEAQNYREAIVRALREATASMPPIKHNGREIPFVPAYVFPNEARKDMTFWCDCGPLCLVFMGVLPAKDPLIQAALEYARLRKDLVHEACMNEPDYSWSIFVSHAAEDRARFLEGMYGVLAFGVSRKTFVSTEGTSTWVTCEVRANATSFAAMRLAIVDDQIVENELHLLRLCPLAWLRPVYLSRFENMPTEFGPVTLKFRLTADSKSLELAYEPKYREQPKQAVLHVPPVKGLSRITLNGKALDWDRKEAAILLK